MNNIGIIKLIPQKLYTHAFMYTFRGVVTIKKNWVIFIKRG